MGWAIPSLHQYAFIEWCSVKTQGHFYLYLYFYRRKFAAKFIISFFGIGFNQYLPVNVSAIRFGIYCIALSRGHCCRAETFITS